MFQVRQRPGVAAMILPSNWNQVVRLFTLYPQKHTNEMTQTRCETHALVLHTENRNSSNPNPRGLAEANYFWIQKRELHRSRLDMENAQFPTTRPKLEHTHIERTITSRFGGFRHTSPKHWRTKYTTQKVLPQTPERQLLFWKLTSPYGHDGLGRGKEMWKNFLLFSLFFC